MRTIVFPGQGSQAKGMGKSLFDDYPELVEKADAILGYSIKELCLIDPNNELNNTEFTQPALYVVNALSYYRMLEDNEKPDFLAGHSLGEFNALLAAECFDFEAGLKLVKKRGTLMSKAQDGAMAAILNSSKNDIERILKENGLNNVDLANYNTPSQIVISGPIDDIAAAQTLFQSGNVLYYPLNTSGAFHSRFMRPSEDKFKVYLKRFKLLAPQIPVISNVTARPYTEESLLLNLSSQISSTVKWCDSIQYLLSENPGMEFLEVGHGDALTKLIETIKRQSGEPSESHTGDLAEETFSTKADTKKPVPDLLLNQLSDVEALTDQKIEEWNAKYPIGTKIMSNTLDYGELETRTEAIKLFAHRAAIYVKGYNGYFDLDEVSVV